MAKTQYIKDLTNGSSVNTELMVFSKELKTFTKEGKETKFLKLELGDNTGTIPAVCWDPDEINELINKGDVISINTILTEHPDYGPQLKISKANLKLCDEFDIADFLPKTSKNTDEMLEFVKTKIKEIENEHLTLLLNSFFNDEKFTEKFKKAPAAVLYHHNFIGGLLEHTVNVIKVCENLCSLYPELNKDLLITGAILHDVGKLEEYQYEKAIDVSEEGGLTGHIVFGDRMLNDKIKALPDFPSELKIRLHHMILSHHLKEGFGSPKKPQFLEAVALGYADYIDSKLQGFKQALEESKDEKEISKYNEKLEQYVYLK
tara:strand:- start:12978 stop:13931 length:954 start_codon:yes stop_codon:yes gene_type:complete